MEEPTLQTLFATAFLLGIIAHHFFFKRFEVDTHPLFIFTVVVSSPFALRYIFSRALTLCILLTITFTTSLLTSLAIYRAYLHPLRQFPGPHLAKLTKLYSLILTAQSGLRWHQINASLHAQYGDYIRTGPRELSITDPAAINFILGFGAKSGKGPVYDSMEDSVNTTRDRDFHTQRRKIWDSSLKTLLSTYKPQIETFTSTLLARVRSNINTPLVVNELTLNYSYDVMTQLAFGEPGGFISGNQGETARSVMTGIKDATLALGLLYHVPWIMTLLTTFAFLPGPMKWWNDWSEKMLNQRKERGAEKPDLMGYLITNTPNTRKGNQLLFADSRVIVAAGSDTTATSLTTLLTLLASDNTLQNAIREEVDPLLSSTPDTFSSSASYSTLDSIINEALRLYPPVLFASQRTNLFDPLFIPSSPHTPYNSNVDSKPQSLIESGTWIPKDTVISMPTYFLHRDPRNFAKPEEFIPERWTTRPELVLNRQAFIPFSTGMTNCPGKNLAMMEIRDVIARTVHEFDVRFPDAVEKSFDMASFMKGTKDCFMARVPEVEVVFTKRER